MAGNPGQQLGVEPVGSAKALLHGKSSLIEHDGHGVFTGLPPEIEAGRYHSLAAIRIPNDLDVTARTGDGEVMGVRHRVYPVDSHVIVYRVQADIIGVIRFLHKRMSLPLHV